MRHLKKLGLASALALVATFGIVGSASATTIVPAGATTDLFSSNSALAVSGGGSVACTNSDISGTTPAVGDSTTWKSFPGTTLAYSGCTAFGFVGAAVTPNVGCHTTATKPILHAMFVSTLTAIGVVTIPSGCTIDVSIAAVGCTLTIPGPQTVGNGTAGTGGIDYTSTNPAVAHINSAVVPTVISNGVGAGCPTAGHHTGTLTGLYTRTAATSNVTVTN
jgi:hypothetical protein